MIDLQRLLITIEANKKFLQQAIRHLNLIQKDSVFTGIIPNSSGNSELLLILEICDTPKGNIYKLEIIGSLQFWYFGTTRKKISKPQIIACLNLLSQRLSLKKNAFLEAEVLEIGFNPAIIYDTAIGVKNVSDFLLKWNYLVRFWAFKTCYQASESDTKKINRKATKMFCKLDYEEENQLYLKKLTIGRAVSFYTYWRLPELTSCYSEYSLALKKVKTTRAKEQIKLRLQKMKPVIRELNRRTEEEILHAENEQELLNIAMYGQYND